MGEVSYQPSYKTCAFTVFTLEALLCGELEDGGGGKNAGARV